GGFGGGIPTCVPGMSIGCACTNGRMGAQICGPDGRYGQCVCTDDRLISLQKGMIGTWTGDVTTPWQPPYTVTVTFRADGTYSARCLMGAPGCVAFYYGTDNDHPAKRYQVDAILTQGEGAGSIDIVFDGGTVNRGELTRIRLGANMDTLDFAFYHDR